MPNLAGGPAYRVGEIVATLAGGCAQGDVAADPALHRIPETRAIVVVVAGEGCRPIQFLAAWSATWRRAAPSVQTTISHGSRGRRTTAPIASTAVGFFELQPGASSVPSG